MSCARRAVFVCALSLGLSFQLSIKSGTAAESSIGSGVGIGSGGEVLTNAHVVENCDQITVRLSSGVTAPATLIARDEKNALAVIRSRAPLPTIAVFRDGSIRAGDTVIALRYPLSGLLASSAKLTVGNVSALAGLSDDTRYLQMTAAVQPGNSGGPLLDSSGHIAGIVTGKLDAALVARIFGDIPQNVNFALKAEVARTFLNSNSISYSQMRSEASLSPSDVGDLARPFTVQIECFLKTKSVERLSTRQDRNTVNQRVALYEEDPKDQQGKRYVGSVIWRTETISPGPGLAPELAVRADVEISERHITMTWSLRRNTDPALPASHMIEILFNLPTDFPGGGIANVPGILMKQSEQARGTPLAGLAVKVTNGFFLIGLSAVEADQQRNMQLLRERSWFDIPIVYTNGGRALLAIERGAEGDQAFAEAFAAWSKSSKALPSSAKAKASNPAGDHFQK
jgi:Trypsin-like peptidase domain